MNDKNFKEGDYVFLLKGPKPGKFGDYYTGPHRILEVISKNNIKIQFKGNSKVVDADRLKVSHINKGIKVKARKKHSKDEEPYSCSDYRFLCHQQLPCCSMPLQR